MITALLLALAAPTAVDAERAFARDAQRIGQWTAFRKYAAEDAVMFVPEVTNAQAWLKDKKDPPVSVFWWPGRSYVSCDGTVAVNTGPWVRAWGKSVGYFTTVWKRQPDGGWEWVYDAGDELKQPRAEGGDIKPVVASCAGQPTGGDIWAAATRGDGESRDQTLNWGWMTTPAGERLFRVEIWDGSKYQIVVDDHFVPPAAPPK